MKKSTTICLRVQALFFRVILDWVNGQRHMLPQLVGSVVSMKVGSGFVEGLCPTSGKRMPPVTILGTSALPKPTPRKTNMSLERDYFSREYIFQPLIFSGHVSFQGSNTLLLKGWMVGRCWKVTFCFWGYFAYFQGRVVSFGGGVAIRFAGILRKQSEFAWRQRVWLTNPWCFLDSKPYRWYQSGSKYWFPPWVWRLDSGQPIYNPQVAAWRRHVIVTPPKKNVVAHGKCKLRYGCFRK